MPMIVRADARRIPLPDQSMDLVIGSPPYIDARDYLEDGVNLGISRQCAEWVDWMLGVTDEALRVSRGLVLWVCAGVTRDRNYQPGPEGLLWEWWKRGGECHCLRPVYWHRVGIPGSGGDQWFRGDIEYMLAFKRTGKLPWSDNTANGHTPAYGPGGVMSNRGRDGIRTNDPWRKQGRGNGLGGRRANGKKNIGTTAANRVAVRTAEILDGESCSIPAIANPGNIFSTGAGGGGQLGSSLAHDNEAPYPVDVPAWFIASHCPPGGSVFDPFLGSGSTIDAAISLGRKGFGCDLRQSQCLLAKTRVATVTPGFVFAETESAIDAPSPLLDPPPARAPLPGQMNFLD